MYVCMLEGVYLVRYNIITITGVFISHHIHDAQKFHHYKNCSCCPCITKPTFSPQPLSLIPSNFLFSKCHINRIIQYLISEAGLFHTEYLLESHLSCSVLRFVVEQYSMVCMCPRLGDHLGTEEHSGWTPYSDYSN